MSIGAPAAERAAKHQHVVVCRQRQGLLVTEAVPREGVGSTKSRTPTTDRWRRPRSKVSLLRAVKAPKR